MTTPHPQTRVTETLSRLPIVFTAQTHRVRSLAKMEIAGKVARVRTGVYTTPETAQTAKPRDLTLAAGLAKLGPQDVLSHFSAAYLHGFPDLSLDLRIHVIRPLNSQHRRKDFCIRQAKLHQNDVLSLSGITLTTVAKTALDCADQLPDHLALAAVDFARKLGASLQELLDCAQKFPARRAHRLAKLTVLSVTNVDSAPESITRYWLHQAGFRSVETQVRIRTSRGTFYADCGVQEIKLAVEYDGKPKYASPDANYKEKLREDAIRALGWTVVRVTAADLRNPALLVARFQSLKVSLNYQATP